MVDVMTIVIIGRCYAPYCSWCCCLNLVLWCGRWWATKADVIASLLSNDRCYSHVADGMATLRWLEHLKKAERALLNEIIRTVNNTLQMLECLRGTCINKLYRVIDQEVMEECKVFMNKTREAKHVKTIYCQKAKFERLWLKNRSGHSKNGNQYKYYSGGNHN